jgi:hypothetical protein
MRLFVLARLAVIAASIAASPSMSLPAIKPVSKPEVKGIMKKASSAKKQQLPAVSGAALDDDDRGLAVRGHATPSARATEAGVDSRSTVRWQQSQVGGEGPINDATTTMMHEFALRGARSVAVSRPRAL